MKQLLVNFFLPVLVVSMTVFAPALTVAAAPASCPSGGSKGQVLQGVGETGSDCDDSGVNTAITSVVTILSYVVGGIAVIMIMVAGLKYITSGGDSNKVGSAKSTLVYALIGVAVAGLAQIFVHYVINTAINGV